jgi:hypothetical protein
LDTAYKNKIVSKGSSNRRSKLSEVVNKGNASPLPIRAVLIKEKKVIFL